MTTKEAFAQLVSQRGWHNDLGISDNTAWSANKNFKIGKLSIERMEELLEKAGFTVKQEKLWQK